MNFPKLKKPTRFGWAYDLVIVLAVIAVAAIGGLVSGGDSDPWYQTLKKPPFNPPGYAFGIVWPILYVLMAISAILVRRNVDRFSNARTCFGLFFLQLGFNLAWSVLFFFFHRPIMSMIDLVCLWLVIVMMAFSFGTHSRIAALLLVPYILWVSFAGYLNGMIIVLNG
ncbi:MAG: TspO protein [Ponticaulis sp.]|nr:TspO protein [Ponticaulis sp.]|tara:strand:- start:6107 stop:6610 length:504 start_codon:yes stop_codon:yes gene_type:complete